jgi:hypothetical protein
MVKAAQRLLIEAYLKYVEVRSLRRTQPIGKRAISRLKTI